MKPETESKKPTEIPSNNNAYCKRNSDLEDVEKRDLFSKNFNCHNRARKTVLFGSPIHYLNATTNKYENIDLSLKTNEDSIINDTNSFKTVFNKNAKSNSVFEISKDNYTVSLKLVNQNGTKGEEKSYNKQVNNDSKFVVKDDDIEYNYRVLNNKVKDEIVINKKQDDYKYDFIIEVNNLEVQLADDGNINLVDAKTKQIKFYIPRPFMVDNDGKQSKDIDCLVTKNSESSYLLSLIPNAGWLNDKECSFPVVIDPEIVDYYGNPPFIIKTYQKVLVNGSGSLGQFYIWQPINSEVPYLNSNYRLEIIFDLADMNFPIPNICYLLLNFNYLGTGTIFINGRSYNYSSFGLNLNQFVNNNSTYHFIIDFADGTNLTAIHPSTPYDLINFEVEYILDEYGETHKTFSLDRNIEMNIDLSDGDFGATFLDTIVRSKTLTFPIFHTYRKSANESECGDHFMLSLHQRITKYGERYFYLNQVGEYERINEKFYYVNDNERHYISKNQVIANRNSELTYSNGSLTFRVFRELLTDSGLLFNSRLSNVAGLAYIEQRINEEKEIQDYLDDCIDAFKSLALFNISSEAKAPFVVSADYDSDNIDSFLDRITGSVLPMEESSIIQHRSLAHQKENLFVEKAKLQNENEDTSEVDFQISLVNDQLSYIENAALLQIKRIKRMYSQYLSKRNEYLALRRIIPQWILIGNVSYGFNYNGDLCSVYDNFGNYLTIIRDAIFTQNGSFEKIVSVRNEEITVDFEYDYCGNLISINNCGNLTKFKYESNNLESILYSNHEFLRFLFNQNNLLLSISTSDQKKFCLTYDDVLRLKQIDTKSFVDNIDVSSLLVIEESNNYSSFPCFTVSTLFFQYYIDRTVFIESGIYHTYYFYNNHSIYMSLDFDSSCNRYYNVSLKYKLEGNLLIEFKPRKPEEKRDDISTIDNFLANSLNAIGIQAQDLPYLSSYTNNQYLDYGESAYIVRKLDSFNRIIKETTNWEKISDSCYGMIVVDYYYLLENQSYPCVKKTISHYKKETSAYVQNPSLEYVEIEEYEYGLRGELKSQKCYILGEEFTKGMTIKEYEYDKKGNQIIKRSYNTLDSATKFYEESEYFDNGLLSKTFGGTKENVTHYFYDSSDKLISEFNTNGVKVSYGYDQLGTLNSISQSTEIGEQNKVNRENLFDSTVIMADGNNRVLFAYDKKRRTKTINHNGVVTSFTYSGSSYDDTSYVYPSNTSINGVQFYGYRADKIVTTAYGVSTEYYYDKRGRLFAIKEGNADKYRANYDSDLLQKEFIRKNNSSSTGFFINYVYNSYRRPIDIEIVDNGNISLTENYGYDDYGKITGKTLNFYGGEYDYYYSYSEDSRHILKAISIFDDYVIHPFADENARYTGREIFDSNNNLLRKERIIYRQIGERSTNVPSSVYYDSFSSGVKTSSTNIKYKYDSSNNITEIIENGVLVNKYQYDSLNRLIREDNRKLNKSFFFAYDNNGNLLSKKDADYTLAKKDEILSFNNEVDCLYDGDKLISFDGESIIYDQYNRPTNYRGSTILWDGNKLVQFNNLAFSYDGLGRRISKGSISYLYDSNGQLIGQNNQGDTLIFAYDYSGIVGFKYNGVEYIYKKNIQGDVIGIIRVDSNQLVASYVYDAWGNHAVLDESGNVTTNHSHIGFINPFRYRSYYFDDETGLYYLKSRYYDPTTCRFISMDNLNYLNPSVVNGLNLWIYCFDNPVSFVDSNGSNPEWWQWLISGLAIGVGAVLCFVPGGQAFGVSLLVAGSLTMVSNILSASGFDGKTVCLITSGLNIVAGIALCFTPFASIGASMIGAGIGGIAGGYISEAFGGSFEIGSFVGSFVGGIAGGKIYDYYKFSKIASQGIVISKGYRYIDYAKAHNLAHYEGMPGYNFVAKISQPIADRLGWANNYHFINSVMKHGGFIYNLGGSLTASYAKEIELIGNYIFLINIIL